MLGQVLALRQLRVLVVRSQSLARLTAGVAGLALLRRLDLSANAKLEIDADVPLGALWELRSLDLSAPAQPWGGLGFRHPWCYDTLRKVRCTCAGRTVLGGRVELAARVPGGVLGHLWLRTVGCQRLKRTVACTA